MKRIGLIGATLALIALLVYGIVDSGKGEDMKTDRYRIERNARLDSLMESNAPDSANLFTWANQLRYRAGNGFSIACVNHEDPTNGYETTEEEPFELEEVENTKRMDRELRRNEIAKRMGEYNEFLQRCNAHRPREREYIFFVDPTSGMGVDQQQNIRETVAGLEIGNRAQQGDGFGIYMIRVGVSGFAGNRQVRIPQRASERVVTSRQQELTEKVEWLVKDEGELPASSLATPLFQALERHANVGTTVHVFSDGCENSELVSCYRDSSLFTDEANWDTLRERISQYAEVPEELTGVKVIWHLEGDPANERLIRSAVRFWQDTLEKAGAEVEVQ